MDKIINKISVEIYKRIHCSVTISCNFFKSLKSHSQKSATFIFDKSAKNVKNNGPKTEKNIFSLLNLLQKYEKMLNCSARYSLDFFKFESLKVA